MLSSPKVPKSQDAVTSFVHMLIRDEPYRELGAHDFDDRRQAELVDQLTRRIERLGYRVTLEPDSFVLYRLTGVAVFNGRACHTEHSLYRPIHKLTTPR